MNFCKKYNEQTKEKTCRTCVNWGNKDSKDDSFVSKCSKRSWDVFSAADDSCGYWVKNNEN